MCSIHQVQTLRQLLHPLLGCNLLQVAEHYYPLKKEAYPTVFQNFSEEFSVEKWLEYIQEVLFDPESTERVTPQQLTNFFYENRQENNHRAFSTKLTTYGLNMRDYSYISPHTRQPPKDLSIY